MTDPRDDPARLERDLYSAYWPLPVSRAIPAAVLGIVITFSPNHSASFGLSVFGVFALVSGALTMVIVRRRFELSPLSRVLVASGAVTVAGGAVALASALLTAPVGVSSLLVVVAAWAAASGALDAYVGLRARRSHPASTDWIVTGVLTLALAVVLIGIPPGFRQEFVGEQSVSGALDAAVVAVGVIGAWAILVAVFLAIAGLSAKWHPRETLTGSVPAEEPR